MRIRRGGEVIYDSSITKDYPPKLINKDVVEMDDFETFFSRGSSVIYDVINVGDASKRGTKLSQVCPGIAFEPVKKG